MMTSVAFNTNEERQEYAETKAVVEPDGVTDSLGQKSIAVVARRAVGHRSTLPATVST